MQNRVTIILKPSHRCNFNCTYCYDRFERSKDSNILPVDDCILILKKFANKFPDYHVIWHGGEPTCLGKDYLDKVMSADIPAHIKWSIQTNGSLLDDEWIKIFKKYKVDCGLSYDGITQTSTRSQPINLNKIYTLFKENDYENGISLLMVVTPQNANTLIESYLETQNYHFNLGFNEVFGENLTKKEYDIIINGLIDLFDYLCINPSYMLPRPFDEIIGYFGFIHSNLCEREYCVGRWFGISPEGDIYPCGKPWTEKYKYGNALLNDNIDFDKLNYKPLKDIVETQLNHCIKCKYFYGCKNGCPFNASKYDDLFDENYCYFRSNLIEKTYGHLNNHINDRSLINKNIIEKISNTDYEGELWRNYKSHII